MRITVARNTLGPSPLPRAAADGVAKVVASTLAGGLVLPLKLGLFLGCVGRVPDTSPPQDAGVEDTQGAYQDTALQDPLLGIQVMEDWDTFAAVDPETGEIVGLAASGGSVIGVTVVVDVRPGRWRWRAVYQGRCHLADEAVVVEQGDLLTWTHDALAGSYDAETRTCLMP